MGGTTRAAHLAGIIVAGLAFWLAPDMPTYRALVVLIGGIWAIGLIGSAVSSIRCLSIGSSARSIWNSTHKTTRQR